MDNDVDIYFTIYEMKGMIDSMNELTELGGEFDNPIIYKLKEKIDSLVDLVKEKQNK